MKDNDPNNNNPNNTNPINNSNNNSSKNQYKKRKVNRIKTEIFMSPIPGKKVFSKKTKKNFQYSTSNRNNLKTRSIDMLSNKGSKIEDQFSAKMPETKSNPNNVLLVSSTKNVNSESNDNNIPSNSSSGDGNQSNNKRSVFKTEVSKSDKRSDSLICKPILQMNNENDFNSPINKKVKEEQISQLQSERNPNLDRSKLSEIKHDNVKEIDNLRGPRFCVNEINSNHGIQLPEGSIRISPRGYINGLRNAKDGITYFGPSMEDENNNIIVDVEICQHLREKIKTYLFLIYYLQEQKKYYIRSSTEALGLILVKVQEKERYDLTRNELVMMGDLFFYFKVFIDDKGLHVLEIIKLSSKKSPSEDCYRFEETYFESQSINEPSADSSGMEEKDEEEEEEGEEINNLITIGRGENCTINFPKNKNFSKIHCCITYDNTENVFYFVDGNFNISSTNGIWIIPKHSMEIHDKMVFKIVGHSKFVIDFEKNVA